MLKICETGNRKFRKPRWRQRPQRQFGPIVLCIARDQWRWTTEVDLTLSSWVPNRDAQTGIMNLFLEGGFRRGKQHAVKMSRDSRRGQSKRDISGLWQLLGSLSKDVFERRTSTGSEAFSLLICRGDRKFVFLSFFSLIKTILPGILNPSTAQCCKKPTSGWRPSPKNAVA